MSRVKSTWRDGKSLSARLACGCTVKLRQGRTAPRSAFCATHDPIMPEIAPEPVRVPKTKQQLMAELHGEIKDFIEQVTPKQPPSDPEVEKLSSQIHAMIARAKPYIDEGVEKGWKPSHLMTIAWCFTATEPRYRKHLNALALNIAAALDRARDRYRQGYYANPFAAEPQPRWEAWGGRG